MGSNTDGSSDRAEAKEGVDDWDKARSIGVDAHARRSISSLNASGVHLTITGIDGPRELAEKTPLAIKLIREMPGPDRPDYWLGVLDSPINVGTENHEREVTHLIVSARWAGTRITSGVRRLPLGIAYVTDPSLLNDSSLDFAKCRYVAIGVGSVTSDGTSAKPLHKVLAVIISKAARAIAGKG